MASAYSTPKDFGNFIQPVNFELANFVLQSKDQKFNYNIQKVEQVLQDFGDLGLVRGQDKEYLAERVAGMIDSMGDIENRDWSDSNVERQISSGLKQSIDGRVLNDIKMSRKYTNYLEQAQKLKEEDPDKYSDINFAMGLRYSGAEEWAQGATNSFGELQLMPKVDYMGQMNETIQDYVKTNGTKSVERVSNGDGTFTEVTRESLNPETIRNLWQANVTPEMQRQMQMEADYMYGRSNESDQQKMISLYEQNAIAERNGVKNELDTYKSAYKKATGEEKVKIGEQIQALTNRNLQLKKEIDKGVSFEEAYLNFHFKGTREKLVEANAFDRVTDVKLNYDELKALKLKKDLAKTDKTEAEKAAESYSTVSDPFVPQEEKVNNVFETTQEGITSSVEGYVQAMTNNEDFFNSYGIEIEEFNKKSDDEKIAFASEQMERLSKDGVDLGAESPYSTEEIKLVSKYNSNKAVYDEVNTGIQSTTDEVARNSFEALTNGIANDTINISNFNNPIIRNIVTSGKKFDNLNTDEKNSFRIAMIDEAIRKNYVSEDTRPFLLKQREELLKGIRGEKYRSQIPDEEMLTSTRGTIGAYTRAGLNLAEGTLDSVAEGLGSILNLDQIFGEQDRAEGNFQEARAYNEEANRRGNILSLFRNDESFAELQADEFSVNGEGVHAADYIRNKYKSATESAQLKADELAPKLTSTSALIINPNIKSQQEMFNRASSYLAAQNSKGASVEDIKKSEMYMRVNPENNTVVFSSKLSRESARFYESEADRMIESRPIPISELGDMGAIMDRVKQQQDEWTLNSDNKYAQNLKFSTKGFATPEQRLKAVEGMVSKLPDDAALALSQSPESLGLTHTEMESFMGDIQRETKTGEVLNFQQEFPNVYNSFASGRGKFEVDYKSKHRQGYVMDVTYSVGDRRIPIVTSVPTGDKTLNPDEKYLEAYQEQTNLFIKLMEGYASGNTKAMDILKEIDKING